MAITDSGLEAVTPNKVHTRATSNVCLRCVVIFVSISKNDMVCMM